MKKITSICGLLFWTTIVLSQNTKILDANTIILKAQKKAKAENKNVFLKFTASWCGWCHKMDDAMQDSTTINLFTNNYIITHLTVLESEKNKHLENVGSLTLMKKYGGENQGLPYWVIINKDGKILANSKLKNEATALDADGDNAGCPAETNEINYFLRVLKNTSSLNDDELQIIQKRFLKINAK